MIEPEFVEVNADNIDRFFPKIFFLYIKYRQFFLDDYASDNSGIEFFYSYILKRSPYFWAILGGEKFAGFVFLDEFTGNTEKSHGAELTVCFEQRFWGKFTRLVGKKFFKYCFEHLKLIKLKAGIYPENNRIRGLLKDCGFEYEGLLRYETLRDGKFQDIELYGLINPEFNTRIDTPEPTGLKLNLITDIYQISKNTINSF